MKKFENSRKIVENLRNWLSKCKRFHVFTDFTFIVLFDIIELCILWNVYDVNFVLYSFIYCKNAGRAGFTTLASWIRMLYIRRVYANGLIGPKIIYSCPWMGITFAHSFCFRTTLSESFDFSSSLQLANKCIYLTFLLSMYVSTVSTRSYLWSKSIGPELLCETPWRSHQKNFKISYTSCKGHGLGSSRRN